MSYTDSDFIERCPHDFENPYAQISRALIRDNSLSPECRGVLIFLLANDGKFKIKLKYLLKQFEGHFGRDYFYTNVIGKLLASGYMKREEVRVGNLKRFVYYVSETPKFKKCFRHPDLQDTGAQDPAEPHSKERKDISTDVDISKEGTPAGTPAAAALMHPGKRRKVIEPFEQVAPRVSLTRSQSDALLERSKGDASLVKEWVQMLSQWKIKKCIEGGENDFGAITSWVIQSHNEQGLNKKWNTIDKQKSVEIKAAKSANDTSAPISPEFTNMQDQIEREILQSGQQK